jgi:hypothetical protein
VLSSSTSTEPPSSSSSPAAVLGTSVERGTTLPRTGVDPTALLMLGLGFGLAGGVLVLGADRLAARRR